jgi:hypothetical protein
MHIDAIVAEALCLLLVSGATLAIVRILDGRSQFDAKRYYNGGNAVLVHMFDAIRTLVLICFGLNARFVLGSLIAAMGFV